MDAEFLNGRGRAFFNSSKFSRVQNYCCVIYFTVYNYSHTTFVFCNQFTHKLQNHTQRCVFLQYLIPYMWKLEFSMISIERGVIDPNMHSLLDVPDHTMPCDSMSTMEKQCGLTGCPVVVV